MPYLMFGLLCCIVLPKHLIIGQLDQSYFFLQVVDKKITNRCKTDPCKQLKTYPVDVLFMMKS